MLNLFLLPANLKGNESKSQIHPTLTRLLHKKVRWDVGGPGHWQNSGITVELRKCNFPTSPCHLHPFSTWQPDQQFPFGTMNNTERNPNKLPTVSKALHYLPSFPFTVLRPQTPRALPASAFFFTMLFCFHQPSTSTHMVGSFSPVSFSFPGYFLRWPLPYLSKVKSPIF